MDFVLDPIKKLQFMTSQNTTESLVLLYQIPSLWIYNLALIKMPDLDSSLLALCLLSRPVCILHECSL